jgi:hypothetical protein
MVKTKDQKPYKSNVLQGEFTSMFQNTWHFSPYTVNSVIFYQYFLSCCSIWVYLDGIVRFVILNIIIKLNFHTFHRGISKQSESTTLENMHKQRCQIF